MPDPVLEIRGREWGAVIQTLRKGGVSKKFFSALGASVLSKNKGGAWPCGPPPWFRHCIEPVFSTLNVITLV